MGYMVCREGVLRLMFLMCTYVQPNEELLKKHYADLSKKPFFPGLVKFMSSGPVVCMVRPDEM